MNEEELKKGCGRNLFKREGGITKCGEEYIPKSPYVIVDKLRLCNVCQARLEGFQKGKLEQKKEDILEHLEFFKDLLFSYNSRWFKEKIEKRIKQLQKEIGDDSQTRQSKETSVEKGGGKAERYLFNSDNVSSADTLKLNHKCPICDKDIYLREDTVNEKGVIYHLGCYLFENHFTINDSLKDIWDNPEDNRWDKEEEKQDE